MSNKANLWQRRSGLALLEAHLDLDRCMHSGEWSVVISFSQTSKSCRRSEWRREDASELHSKARLIKYWTHFTFSGRWTNNLREITGKTTNHFIMNWSRMWGLPGWTVHCCCLHKRRGCQLQKVWAAAYTRLLAVVQDWWAPLPSFEERALLSGPWDEILGVYLPSKVLIGLVVEHPSDDIVQQLSLLSWTTPQETTKTKSMPRYT